MTRGWKQVAVGQFYVYTVRMFVRLTEIRFTGHSTSFVYALQYIIPILFSIAFHEHESLMQPATLESASSKRRKPRLPRIKGNKGNKYHH